jgi:hypothetical protein
MEMLDSHTPAPAAVGKNEMLRGSIHIYIYIDSVCAHIRWMNSTYSICHIIDFRACWLYFLSIPFFRYLCLVYYMDYTVYSLRTLLVLRPSRRLTRHRNWSISSTSYLPVLIVSLRYVVTSTLIRLSIRSKSLKKKPRDSTYLSFY